MSKETGGENRIRSGKTRIVTLNLNDLLTGDFGAITGVTGLKTGEELHTALEIILKRIGRQTFPFFTTSCSYKVNPNQYTDTNSLAASMQQDAKGVSRKKFYGKITNFGILVLPFSAVDSPEGYAINPILVKADMHQTGVGKVGIVSRLLKTRIIEEVVIQVDSLNVNSRIVGKIFENLQKAPENSGSIDELNKLRGDYTPIRNIRR